MAEGFCPEPWQDPGLGAHRQAADERWPVRQEGDHEHRLRGKLDDGLTPSQKGLPKFRRYLDLICFAIQPIVSKMPGRPWVISMSWMARLAVTRADPEGDGRNILGEKRRKLRHDAATWYVWFQTSDRCRGEVRTMKLYRTRFEIRAIVTFVGSCAHMRAREISAGHPALLALRRMAAQRRRVASTSPPENLGTLGADPAFAVPPLARAMRNDTSAPIRKQSAQSLASVTSKLNDGPTTAAAVKAFVRVLKDNDPSVREAAAKGIGQLDGRPGGRRLRALLEAASDANEWVRGAAVAASSV